VSGSDLRTWIERAMEGHLCPDCHLPHALDAVMRVINSGIGELLDQRNQAQTELKRAVQRAESAEAQLESTLQRFLNQAETITQQAEQIRAAEAERDRLRAELLTWLPRLGAHLDLGPEHDVMAMAMLGGTVKLAMKALYAALDQAPAEEASGT